ncbi:type II toxin-antitoxin system Phd/YefM family antitoxin [Mesorhizobium australafricanum]|uniref:Type II toxin-antitoxin system prevent-host-death family antitoxin n=1 Tax=Mesorhizobium australafricanum TaxID=3072311 RepID=A0ABU4WQT5_9HYPH|nr:type II toxin-antitoxin system prevent-host-death family antitoxin [Mesorhizobium sp. VK3E]MDX8438385.1 type II toxin-antitoxin system prevent-host-death family antitoxin [Mesorhizobium sp. VK3E]
MDDTVSIADIEFKLPSILHGVREGQSYVVVSNGRPVARIVPVNTHENPLPRLRAALLSRLERQPLVGAGNWTRDDAYED